MKKVLLLILCSINLAVYATEQQLDQRIDEVLAFWFGELTTDKDYPQEKSKIWFQGGAEVDSEIRNRFEALVVEAASGQLDYWKQAPRGRLALIVLVDQFPRNIYRGTPQVFAYDSIAQELTLEGLASRDDQKLFPIERTFFYLPLEHAEDYTLQVLSVAKFQELVADADLSLVAIFDSFASYAVQHYDIIKRFGRFPHRNTTLGRESTPDELEFLKSPNSSF